MPIGLSEKWARYVGLLRERKEDFIYDATFWVACVMGAAVLSAAAKLLTGQTTSSWLIPIIIIIAVIGMIVFPIVRELRKPHAVIQIGSGAKVGRIITPIDPVKAAKGVYFENQSLRITDLLSDDGNIRGKTCKACVVRGPAVLASGDAKTSIGHKFHHGDKSLYINFQEGPENACGVIMVFDSRFDECEFHNVGLAGRFNISEQTGD